MGRIFDSHAHYDDKAFDRDREEILSGLFKQGVGTVVNICASLDGIPKVLALSEKYDFVYAAVGVHPTEVYERKGREIEEVEHFAVSSEKVVAIGETGLDYHYPDTEKDRQKKWFAMQIDLAKRLKLPMVIHSRDAAKDTLDMIRAEGVKDVGGVMHCFSYEPEMAKIYTDMGFYLGIGGVVTFKRKKNKEILRRCRLNSCCLKPTARIWHRNRSGKAESFGLISYGRNRGGA